MSLQKNSLVPVQSRGACDWVLPNTSVLRGLYMLTREGNLARIDAWGKQILIENLDSALRSQLPVVLEYYLSGVHEGVNLGLIADARVKSSVGGIRLIFSNWLLNELFSTGRGSGLPLTVYERRNKVKSLFQGMELLLHKQRQLDGGCPHYCPVLIESEPRIEVLRERYEFEIAVDVPLYEVLDLSASVTGSARLRRELMRMNWNMRSAQMELSARGPGPHGGLASPEVSRHDASLPAVIHAMGPQDRRDPKLPPVSDTYFESGDPVSSWLLEWFTPFNELTDTQRDIIAGYETIDKAQAGSTLIERGSSDEVCIYLVEGSLELTAADGSRMRVDGGTRRSRLPISMLSPHEFDVMAITDVSVITFNKMLINKVNEITRTYTSIGTRGVRNADTGDLSNSAQAIYLHHVGMKWSMKDA